MAKGGFPGMGNMNGLVKQAQKMQKDIQDLQTKLDEITVEVSAGGGVITAVANGNKEIVKLTINPEAVDPDDVDTLQDLVMVAVNEAIRQVGEKVNVEMNKITGGVSGFNMPGLF